MWGITDSSLTIIILALPLAGFFVGTIFMGTVEYEVKVIREEGIEPLQAKIVSLEKQLEHKDNLIKQLETMQPPNYSFSISVLGLLGFFAVLLFIREHFDYKKAQLEITKEMQKNEKERFELLRKQLEESKVRKK